MKLHYVYELINSMGTVEYVGESINPKKRFYFHTKVKPRQGAGMGKFYGRLDLTIHIVDSFDNRKDALALEDTLKTEYNMERTEKTRMTNNITSEGRSKGGHAKKTFANRKRLTKIEYDKRRNSTKIDATKANHRETKSIFPSGAS